MKIFFSIVFAVWFGIAASFSAPLAFAAVSCSNFNSASYTVPGGASSFLINTPIATNLKLQAKNSSNGGAENVEIVVVMDNSISMSWTDGSSQTKIEAAKDAMNALVDVIVAAANPNNRIALVTFARNATTNLSFTNDYTALRVAINNVAIASQGGTAIGSALYEAGAELKKSPLAANTRRFIILASDGVQNTGISINAGKANVPSDVTVYTIGIGSPDYLDEPAMKDIAHTTGAKDGEYYHSTVPELVSIFENLTKNIVGTFTLKNVALQFVRDDIAYTDFTTAVPVPNSYNPASGIIQWNNLGNFTNGQQKNITINYVGVALRNNIPLNTSLLTLNYTIFDTTCTESVPVNVLFVDVVDVPPPPPDCTDTTWSPDTDAVCSPISFTQTSNCGNTRTREGTKLCTQCSDNKDNDGDGYIDYPADAWCFSLQDNSESDPHFFEF